MDDGTIAGGIRSSIVAEREKMSLASGVKLCTHFESAISHSGLRVFIFQQFVQN